MSVFNESKFNMWRACVSALWADGKIEPQERDWMEQKIESLPFTEEQRAILVSELAKENDFASIVAGITDKKDRAFLAHQLRVIGHLDGVFSHEEKTLQKEWNELVLAGVDLQLLEQIIADDEKASYHEDEVFKVHNKNSLFESLLRSAQKIYNPGDYKFPKD